MPVITFLYPNIDRIICEISGYMYIQFQIEVHWLQSNSFLFYYEECLDVGMCFAVRDTWCCIVVIFTLIAVSISSDTKASVVHSD